jgi:hypothetical protein
MNTMTILFGRLHGQAVAGALLIGMLFPLAAPTFAQESIAARITISQTAGGPGTDVAAPIFLVTAEGVRVGAISLRITFPSALVTLKQAKSDVKIRNAVKPDAEDPALAVLELEIDGAEPGTVIPDGQIADLTFQISKDAKLEEYIALKGTAVVRTPDAPAAEVAPVRVYEGLIMVTADQIFSCFFYMH